MSDTKLNGPYYRIVFLQNSDDFDSYIDDDENTGSDAFFNADPKDQLEFLKQWDYGEYDEQYKRSSAGNSDDVTEFVGTDHVYILTINYSLEYAGLEIVLLNNNK